MMELTETDLSLVYQARDFLDHRLSLGDWEGGQELALSCLSRCDNPLASASFLISIAHRSWVEYVLALLPHFWHSSCIDLLLQFVTPSYYRDTVDSAYYALREGIKAHPEDLVLLAARLVKAMPSDPPHSYLVGTLLSMQVWYPNRIDILCSESVCKLRKILQSAPNYSFALEANESLHNQKFFDPCTNRDTLDEL